MNKCYICGTLLRRGYPMIKQDGEEVIICERCKRIWIKAKAEQEENGGANDEL